MVVPAGVLATFMLQSTELAPKSKQACWARLIRSINSSYSPSTVVSNDETS